MQILHQKQALFEDYLQAQIFQQEPVELYGPVNYILSLGGKRLRPVLLMLGHELYDDRVERSLAAALAIELFHNFTLMHDDIMDEAPLRRGQATVHQKYNLNTGILSGDVMLVKAYEFLLKSEPKKVLPHVFEAFTQCALKVCEGQQLDMNFERNDNVSLPEYLKMIELKTSVLVGAALKIGALLGGSSSSDAEMLYRFGCDLGIAFQLQDDVLDTFGNAGKVGKKIGGDIIRKKKTCLYLLAKESSSEQDRETLTYLYKDSKQLDDDDLVRAVTTIFERLEVKQSAQDLQENYRQSAFRCLGHLEITNEKRLGLEAFAWWLMNREA